MKAVDSEAEATIRASVYNVALRGLSSGSRFVLFGALARLLPVAEVGRFGLVSATVGLAGFVLGGELHAVTARALLALAPDARPPLARAQLRFHLVSYLFAAPLFAVPCALGLLPWDLVGWVVALSISDHLARELHRLCVTMSRPFTANVMLFVRTGAWVYLWLAWIWKDPTNARLGTLWVFWFAGVCGSIALGLVALRALLLARVGAYVSLGAVLQLARGAWPLYAAVIARTAMPALDRFALQSAHGEIAVGPYTFFAGVTNLIVVIIENGAIAILGPRMIESYQRGETVMHNALMRRFTLTVVWMVAVLMLGLFASTDLLLDIADKQAYADARATYWALLCGSGLTMLSSIPNFSLYVRKYDRVILQTTVLGLVAFLAPLLWLVEAYSSLGAAIALCAGALVTLISQSVAWSNLRLTSTSH